VSSLRPAIPFYVRDWLASPGRAGLSLAARGLWIDCIALMHDSPVYGRLLRADGGVMTDAQLALRLGAKVKEVERLIAQLLTNGMGARGADGAFESPRMMRDEHRRMAAKENGKKGGNPNLCGVGDKRMVKTEVNPEVNHEGYPGRNDAVAVAVAITDKKQQQQHARQAPPAPPPRGSDVVIPSAVQTWADASDAHTEALRRLLEETLRRAPAVAQQLVDELDVILRRKAFDDAAPTGPQLAGAIRDFIARAKHWNAATLRIFAWEAMQRIAPPRGARAGRPRTPVAEKNGPALRDFTNYGREDPVTANGTGVKVDR